LSDDKAVSGLSEWMVCQCANSNRLTKGFTHCCKSRRVPCAKTVPESDVFMPLGLALSEKQIPQITENTEKPK